MIGTILAVIFGIALFFEFVVYWLSILNLHLEACQTAKKEGDLLQFIEKCLDAPAEFYFKAFKYVVLVAIGLYLRSIGF